MATVNSTLSCTATSVPKKVAQPQRILKATEVSVPRKIVNISRTYSRTATGTVTFYKTWKRTVAAVSVGIGLAPSTLRITSQGLFMTVNAVRRYNIVESARYTTRAIRKYTIRVIGD